MTIILQLALIIIASKLAGGISARLGQPPVLGKLLIGIVLGPSILGWITETATLSSFSEIGVILLMFIAGLETDMEQFRQSWKASTLVGLGGILLPLMAGFAAGELMGMTAYESWFLGLLLSATSVSISVQALRDMNKLQSREGAAILGAAVIDDVVVIIALAFLMSLASGHIQMWEVVGSAGVFFVGAVVVGWWVVPWFMKRFTRIRVSQTVISSALIVCFVFAYMAEVAGVAAIIGAYLAGLAIGRTNFRSEVAHKVETIGYAIFVPVFFAMIGVSAQLSGIASHWLLVVTLSVVAVATKLVGAAAGAKVSGFGWRSSLGIGTAMVSRGEVALILAAIGLESGLLDADMFAVAVVVILVTTVVTPPLMNLVFDKK